MSETGFAMSARARLAVLPAFALVAIAGWEIVATRSAATATPDDAAWEQAASFVRANYRPGDLITFAPRWIDPVGRLHLGDLIPLEMAGRMDGDRYGRVWELTIRGARAPEVGDAAPTEQREFSGVTVRQYQRPPAVIAADITDPESLLLARTEGTQPRVEFVEVAFAPHRCVVFSAPPNRRSRLLFFQLTLARELVGYFGIADDVFARKGRRDPIKLTVEVDGRTIATATAAIDQWVKFRADTPAGRHEVAFSIEWQQTMGSAAPKRVCIAAEARQ